MCSSCLRPTEPEHSVCSRTSNEISMIQIGVAMLSPDVEADAATPETRPIQLESSRQTNVLTGKCVSQLARIIAARALDYNFSVSFGP